LGYQCAREYEQIKMMVKGELEVEILAKINWSVVVGPNVWWVWRGIIQRLRSRWRAPI
jgi:hypothetical protein